jgi:predicted alpha/beta-hydrolase family hydrolase
MASLAVAEGMPADGLVFLGYPLHAPGKPERIRDEHLYGIRVPMLFVEGTRDPFARADLLAGVLKKLGKVATLHSVEGGDHSFKVRGVKADPREVGASLAPVAAGFVKSLPA